MMMSNEYGFCAHWAQMFFRSKNFQEIIKSGEFDSKDTTAFSKSRTGKLGPVCGKKNGKHQMSRAISCRNRHRVVVWRFDFANCAIDRRCETTFYPNAPEFHKHPSRKWKRCPRKAVFSLPATDVPPGKSMKKDKSSKKRQSRKETKAYLFRRRTLCENAHRATERNENRFLDGKT